jgi:hypothetical protein
MEGNPQDRKLRTRFALKALDLGEMFQSTFDGFSLSGETRRKVVLTVPEGQSTGGGAAANQSISLVPDDGKSGILVAGTVHGASMTAELRGYPYLRDLFKLRYHGQRFAVTEPEYQAFLEKARGCLETNGYTVTVVNQLPAAQKQHLATSPQGGDATALWVVLGVLLLAGVGVAVYFLALK